MPSTNLFVENPFQYYTHIHDWIYQLCSILHVFPTKTLYEFSNLLAIYPARLCLLIWLILVVGGELLSKTLNIKIYRTIILPVVLYGWLGEWLLRMFRCVIAWVVTEDVPMCHCVSGYWGCADVWLGEWLLRMCRCVIGWVVTEDVPMCDWMSGYWGCADVWLGEWLLRMCRCVTEWVVTEDVIMWQWASKSRHIEGT